MSILRDIRTYSGIGKFQSDGRMGVCERRAGRSVRCWRAEGAGLFEVKGLFGNQNDYLRCSCSRGINSTRLHGRWRLSNWDSRISSQPSLTAPVLPGSANK